MSESLMTARELMALVDEFPSEPLTFERKIVEAKIAHSLDRFVQRCEDELSQGFDTGYEMGYADCRDELHSTIQDLEDQIQDLKEALSGLETENSQLLAISESTDE